MNDNLKFDIANIRTNETSGWYCVDANSENKQVRYLLGKGKINKDTVIVIGVNPSTADEKKEDNTMTRVKKKLDSRKYNSFVMINIFPLRKTNPKELPKINYLNENDEFLHKQNLLAISYILKEMQKDISNNSIEKDIKVWCAWGSTIDDRKYLRGYLKDIIELFNKYNVKYYHVGPISKNCNPHHPLFVSDSYNLEDFNINEYIYKINK